ncbi:MAG TPA: hypothetical protein PLT26_05810 [Anaerolineaceae bacterium]|nr:hypothetical protein [Anaerolineaceae bacterium]HQH85018.1 hypothetical protein [Anaerolineaceae bacterium]
MHTSNKKPVLFPTILLVVLFALLLSACTPQVPEAFEYSENDDKGDLVLYVFWGDGCSHCEAAKPFLGQLNETYPTLRIRGFEIWYSKPNAALYTQMCDHYGLPEGGRGTPTFFLGEHSWVGYSEDISVDIEAAVKACLETDCPDAGAGIMPGAAGELSTSDPSANPNADIINIPLIGPVDLSKQSIWISTILIAIVDGVNPCSIWVLTMLLALTLHTGSRKKVAIIGVIFLTVTALIYALFIAGLFTVLSVVSFIGWIQVVVALLALFFAIVNIKDYFWYKEGLSFTIADDKKGGIFKNIRKVMDASQSFWAMAGATVVMAAGVSLVEFSCTAGFPVLWTNLLVSQKIAGGLFILLLVVYMLIYQLDELVIFFTAVYSLKASRLEEKHGRILKLIGGMLMLTLAGVMLIDPSWMNSLSKSLLIFAIAFGLVVLVLLLHRVILPAFGIWIGTEAAGQSKKPKRR